MNNTIITLVMISMYFNVFAQQNPQYSQYFRNQYMVNPGAAGIYDFTDITVSGRYQWLGFTNAPKTTYASVTTQICKKEKIRYNPSLRVSTNFVKNPEVKTGKPVHAIGGQIVADQYGAFSNFLFSGTYAYHLPLSNKVMLAMGTRLGISNHSFDREKAIVKNLNDPEYITYNENQLNRNIINIGTGFFLYSKKLYVGISADQLTKDFINFGSGSANYNIKIHGNITAGYKINIVDSTLTLTPSILLKKMYPTPSSMEGTVQLEYKEFIWGGISYRHNDAVVISTGLNISRKLKFGYSYDFPISKFNSYSRGSHELILGIMIR
jgi:type IX secretion system PorP/SprF family membrane protein